MILLKRQVFELRNEVWLPHSVEEVFPFFADPSNLEHLTPSFLKFEILTPGKVDMEAGAQVFYRVNVRGIPVIWQTEFTAWEPPHRFVDIQLKGPYHLWFHEHTFEAKDGGTLAKDYVRYSMFGGFITQKLMVGRDLRTVFDYRSQQLKKIFAPEESSLMSE